MQNQAHRETWCEAYARAYSYGHNTLRLCGPNLARFAHAFADITEDETWPLPAFFHAWDAGTFDPDHMGRYHHTAWFLGYEKRVA